MQLSDQKITDKKKSNILIVKALYAANAEEHEKHLTQSASGMRESLRITFRFFTILFWASNLARVCLLLRIAWYCFALTYIGSSSAGSTGNITGVFVVSFCWGWT